MKPRLENQILVSSSRLYQGKDKSTYKNE